MDKKDLFDALDDFSQTLLVTLAGGGGCQENLKSVVGGKYCSASGK